MKKLLLYFIFISLATNSFGQKTGFTDLDEALKEPEIVQWLHLSNQTKYSNSKELPTKLSECKNLNKIYFGWHKNFDLPKLFKLLSQLPKLDTLEMYACDLKEIPKEIGLLTNLKYLKLDLNHITKISPEIQNLKSLEYLNIGSNKLVTLPKEIGTLSNLTQLLLTSNDIVELPISICNLQNLQELTLTFNNLKSLPNDIYKLKSLKKLALFGNKLQSLPKTIGQLSLDEIYLGGYQNEFTQFPYEIFQITTLKHLGIYDIKIDSFPNAISNLKNLNSIGLRNLKDFDWSSGLLKLSKLTTINKADIGFERYGEISKEISELKNLSELKLTGSTKSYQTMQYVSELTNLMKLQFDYYIDTILPPEIRQLTHLKYLELGKSKLYSLPPEIGNLMNLQEINLSTNWGQSVSIPKEIGKLVNLKKIDFGWCNIKEIPDEIGNLSNLEELNIWGGDLTSLPTDIGKLKKLEKLFLSGNELQNLPAELFNLKDLKFLNLSDNELVELDSNIYKLYSLEDLDLSGNINLKVIPESLGMLKMLSNIDLSNTQIKQLPKSLINLPKLERIKLCKTLIDNTKEIDAQYKDKIDWEWSCRDLERLLVNFEEKYGKETTKLISKKDTLIFNYTYSYNEPNVIDEEYTKTITIKILKSVIENKKTFTVPDPDISIAVTFFSIWYFETDYKDLQGQIQIIEIGKNKINLSISLTGKFNGREETRELINKTLEYDK
jgi:Leucine-rich repeat (LRR) protein